MLVRTQSGHNRIWSRDSQQTVSRHFRQELEHNFCAVTRTIQQTWPCQVCGPPNIASSFSFTLQDFRQINADRFTLWGQARFNCCLAAKIIELVLQLDALVLLKKRPMFLSFSFPATTNFHCFSINERAQPYLLLFSLKSEVLCSTFSNLFPRFRCYGSLILRVLAVRNWNI